MSTWSSDFAAEKSIAASHIGRYRSLSGWTRKGRGVHAIVGQYLKGHAIKWRLTDSDTLLHFSEKPPRREFCVPVAVS